MKIFGTSSAHQHSISSSRSHDRTSCSTSDRAGADKKSSGAPPEKAICAQAGVPAYSGLIREKKRFSFCQFSLARSAASCVGKILPPLLYHHSRSIRTYIVPLLSVFCQQYIREVVLQTVLLFMRNPSRDKRAASMCPLAVNTDFITKTAS